MKIVPRFSLNFNARPMDPISVLVLHYTGMKSAEEALLRLCDPASQVSSHYVVDEDGTIYQLVEEEMRAWHAGVSYWRGRENINDISIGIEIVNPGHEFGYRAFPQAQMQAVAALARDICDRHPAIEKRNVVGHSDIAPARKEDPGELFNWAWLAEQGVGLWPQQDSGFRIQDSGKENSMGREARLVHRASPESQAERPEKKPGAESLKDYGYSTENLKKAILAFQRHFRPASLTGQWDRECEATLSKLLEICG